ncbi:glutathione transferase [Favolaschia claudopus]|uniref:Glutathione transferase n=1 Tax=Favolaschia claudopus TaxID=2862362 RepID=A0AAW0ED57_9AGAR
MSEQKNYHLECTGAALGTVKQHTESEDITLFGSCFCPFVQRVWVALESPDEVDPYKKPADLLEVSPKGLVPGLKLHKYTPPRALNESTVILEYLEEALVRLQCDHVSRSIVPSFYRYLQAQEESAQIEHGKEFRAAIEGLVALLERAEREIVQGGGAAGVGEQKALGLGLGLWLEDGDLNLTDAVVAPWLFRATNVLKHYRGFEMPNGNKFDAWISRLFAHPAFKATCSTEELYLDSYERYAQNRPNTSQVANAINSGKPLP